MSKPVSVERETLGARWRVSFYGPHAQIEKFDEGAWRRVHFGQTEDILELANCIDDAHAATAAPQKGRGSR